MSKCPYTDKVSFTKKGAQTFVNEHPERQLRIYPCSCGCWHLTHKKKGDGGPIWEIPLHHKNEFEKLINNCPG
jgi:hypothetical protein